MKQPFPWILAMLQPEALPGSYLNQGQSFDEILIRTLTEARQLAALGYDGFLLQNMHDGPLRQQCRPETIAFMTVIAARIKECFPDKLLGLLINWDGVASLSAAAAVQADFIRVEHLYTGVSVGMCGFLEGQCEAILELKKRLGCAIPVYADAQEVNGHFLLAGDKAGDAVRIVKRAFADGLFLSGTQPKESLELIRQVRKKLPDTPIFLGGGATGDNIAELLQEYDGVSVATWIKDGDMRNPINEEKARIFSQQARLARRHQRERHV